MSALPEALARWSPLVADFPKEVALSLAPWMEQLARAIGPLRAHTRRGEGEPDGVDGVTRRAPLDRLLDTERLLATEVPDEFVRRAAQAELLFHALALKELRPARASLLLVDAGPAQLGAPRLAHLAIALVLAARAKEAGARFAWALQQDPPADDRAPRLVTGVEAPLPALLLLDRRALPPTRDDLAAWESFAARAGWDDVWFVGADAVPSKRLRGGAVRVTDPVARGVSRLDVEVECGGRVLRRALPLPDPATQVAVLRDPRILFAKPAPAPAPARPTSATDTPAGAPVFLCDGRKLAAPNANGDVLVFSVPNVPQTKRSKPRRWNRPAGETVLAVGWHQRRLVLLSRRAGALLRFDWCLDVFPMARAPLAPATPDAVPPDRAPDGPLGVMHFLLGEARARRAALLRAPDGRVIEVADGALRVWTRGALAMDTLMHRVLIACAPPDPDAATDPSVDRATLGENRARAVVGTMFTYHRVIASTDAAGAAWRVEAPSGEVFAAEPGDEVLGLAGHGRPDDPLCLVVVTADRHAVVARGKKPRALARFAEGIVGAALSPTGRELAVVTASGALRVYALPSLHLLVARGHVEEAP